LANHVAGGLADAQKGLAEAIAELAALRGQAAAEAQKKADAVRGQIGAGMNGMLDSAKYTSTGSFNPYADLQAGYDPMVKEQQKTNDQLKTIAKNTKRNGGPHFVVQ
jgi:hypothetical protein